MSESTDYLDTTKALQHWMNLIGFHVNDMRDARGYLRRGKPNWAMRCIFGLVYGKPGPRVMPDPAKLTQPEIEMLDDILAALVGGFEEASRAAQGTLNDLYQKQREEYLKANGPWAGRGDNLGGSLLSE